VRTLEELKALTDFMRAEGIIECEGIKLGPPPPVVDPEPDEAVKKIIKLGKKGRDGLDFHQQVELYGAPQDATPDVFSEE
jgi:hypothetical protein